MPDVRAGTLSVSMIVSDLPVQTIAWMTERTNSSERLQQTLVIVVDAGKGWSGHIEPYPQIERAPMEQSAALLEALVVDACTCTG